MPVSIKYGLQTADYGPRTGYKIQTRYKMQTADCGLRTWYKIPTMDYVGKNGSNWFR